MNEEKKEFILTHPIPLKGKDGQFTQVSVLRLGRVKAKHLRLLPKDLLAGNSDQISPTDVIPLIAGLADSPLKCIEELDLKDLIKISEVLGELLGELDSPEIGKKNSG